VSESSSLNMTSLLPAMILAAGGLLILLVNAFTRDRAAGSYRWLALVSAVVSLVLCFRPLAMGAAFNGTAMVDGLALAGSAVVLVVLIMLLLGGQSYLDSRRVPLAEYHGLSLFAAVGMLALCSAGDLVVVFLGIEILSISLYCMAALLNEREGNREAALKYFLTGSFASSFLVFGMALVFGYAGSTNLEEIRTALAVLDGSNWMLVGGILLMLVGFLFKVSAVPFHNWAPDVYDGSATIVTAFMATAAKAAAFTGFARVFVPGLENSAASWVPVLAVCAGLTMLVGNFSALVQTSFKRMLAYSGIAHAGYLLLGILAAGHNPVHVRSVLFYLLPYVLVNGVLFLVGAAISRQRSGSYALEDYKGLAADQPWLAILLTVCLLALAGIPPTAGFVGKFYLFMGAVESGHVPLAVLGLLTSVVSVYFYLRVVVYAWFHKAPAGSPALTAPDGGLMLVTTAASALLLALGLWPNLWLYMTQNIMG
jgi:NADH-quinone oxidoreductase subunit N